MGLRGRVAMLPNNDTPRGLDDQQMSDYMDRALAHMREELRLLAADHAAFRAWLIGRARIAELRAIMTKHTLTRGDVARMLGLTPRLAGRTAQLMVGRLVRAGYQRASWSLSRSRRRGGKIPDKRYRLVTTNGVLFTHRQRNDCQTRGPKWTASTPASQAAPSAPTQRIRATAPSSSPMAPSVSGIALLAATRLATALRRARLPTSAQRPSDPASAAPRGG